MKRILGPGLYDDLSPEVYFADPCKDPSLSASVAHTLVSRSPRHAWMQHPRFGAKGKKPTREMDLGSVVHALLLEKGKDFVVIRAPAGEPEFEDFKKKAAKEARDAARAAGKVPLLQRQLDEAVDVASAIRYRLGELGIRLGGKSEFAAIWDERASDGSVVRCRGMLDKWDEDAATIYDLKIVRSAHPRACQSHMVGFGGDIQSAAYVRAMEQHRPCLAGRVQFVFLFCEVDPPHCFCVTPVVRAGTMRELGEQRWQRAINTWARCVATNQWPGYVTDVTAIEAPAWALSAELELSENGAEYAKPDGPSESDEVPLNGDSDYDVQSIF